MAGDGQDLLDRQEVAAEDGVAVATWDDYRTRPELVGQSMVVGGVEHWPRAVLRAFREDRPGRGSSSTGRPRGSGDMVPIDELPVRAGELLDAEPAVTTATVVEQLGVAYATAQKVLARLRGERIADLLEQEPDLSPSEAAGRLGYPVGVRRAAVAMAAAELNARRVRPYLQQVADFLAEHGLAPAQRVEVQYLGDDVLAAAVLLGSGSAVPALVWDGRCGWRTAVSRRHPIGKETDRPQGAGIRYLASGHRPEPAEVLDALTGR
ncbi:DUF6292 family protein [Streptomyces sp. HUAS TT7]|uniref:DUF6292 family protein n=1 Tax=Streptomyces sp. HUAS TT7 TaxID=3447507 RepID=UPI003F655384